jgi:hypothetical protein
MPYRHTQRGTWIILLCLLLAALHSGQWPPAVGLLVLFAVAIVLSSLTIEVKEGELRWHFGPGFWSYRLALDDIEKIAIVRNRWWNGFGIRSAASFRLYNVSGTKFAASAPTIRAVWRRR